MPAAKKERGQAAMSLDLGGLSDGLRPNLINKTTQQTAKVSLTDCLACSGCVTSAETVLIQQQSVAEFYEKLANPESITIVTISPQARTSLAAYFGITPLAAFKKLTTFFKSLGVGYVFDTTCSGDFSLIEAQEEFVSRYREAQQTGNFQQNLPLLASSCPGWICYAEKSVGAEILPLISSTKSPQQIMGSIVKRFFAEQIQRLSSQIYHVAIMPCYDRKLEASRTDFAVTDETMSDQDETESSIRDVDTVLTSGEVLDMLNEKNLSLDSLPNSPIDRMFSGVTEDESALICSVEQRAGSDGYLESIFRYAAKELFGKTVEGPLQYKMGRNNDLREVVLEENGQVLLKFAAAYGFRNIQNIVQKIKRKKADFHYVEIMACPGGCLSGGGQIKPAEGKKARELLEDLEILLHHSNERTVRDPRDNETVQRLYRDWLGGMGSEISKEMLRTQYRAVEKTLVNPLTEKW
eukprot:GILK01003285.1.p1 GENE.GILK01003285.1~~GILK01003285.1.p1  ORF type:complete len:505 (-),score=90.58 GILK01003285.1:106-1503(-)